MLPRTVAMWVQRAVLEDHGDVATREARSLASFRHPATGPEVISSNSAIIRSSRELAAAGWSQQDEKLPVFGAQIHTVSRRNPPGKPC